MPLWALWQKNLSTIASLINYPLLIARNIQHVYREQHYAEQDQLTPVHQSAPEERIHILSI